MEESQRSQPGNPSNGSDLMDDWVRVCDTCGGVGDEYFLVSCNKCTDGASHTYCMRVKLFEKPKSWTCEECAPTAGTNKLVEDDVEVVDRRKTGNLSKSSINLESSEGGKFNSRPSYPSKSKTIGVSSTGNLSAQRHGVPLEAPTAQKARATERRAVFSGSSEPCTNSFLSEDFSCEESEWAKTKSANDIVYSVPPRSGIFQEKEKVPRACGDKKRVSTLAQLDEKKRALERRIVSHQTSTTHNHSSLGREPPSEKLEKAKLRAAGTATSLNPSSNGSFVKEKLTYGLCDGSPNLDLQTDIAQNKCSLSAGSLLKSNSSKAANLKPKGQLAKAGRLQKQKVERGPTFHDDRKGKGPKTVSKSMASDCAFSKESNATGSKVLLADSYELNNHPMSLLASDSAVAAGKKEKEIISGGDTYFSGSRFCNPDGVGRSGQSDHRSRPSIYKTHKGSNSTNKKKKNVSQQAERPAKAAAPMTGPASDEMPPLRDLAQVEAATLLQGLVVPNTDHSWLGKFLIHNSEGIPWNCDGVLAHLSNCASLEVREVFDRLPGIIILEELPRVRIWPPQFMGSQVTGENIALYFFAKHFDSYDYRGLMNYMINNDLALKGNLDGVELLIFPSNILPERSQLWNQMMFLWGVFKVQKVNNSANTPVSNSLKQGNGDTVKRGAIDLNAYTEDENVGTNLNLAVQGRSTTPENGSVRIEHHVKELPTSLSPAPRSTGKYGPA
ncbi:uncharacterized protein LOC130716887 [Lotus japonicus]|uniref:uncharacterized protein LOC130716887 n=1 Tax=Lotus japonicus TaxID=34305 RepID=UPI0025908C61|nr:uncharacterized protein LOC130716887 [Lotus japonicus]XP_057422903.1 uncharacterized protein LOC130716887 [Lotus japonicus]XP_057422904.1 uncharacterized protein LOC130716887 [Lotus japonicus]